jgi:tetratricopeptide (TPR) repeat protein
MNKAILITAILFLSLSCLGQNYWTKFQELSVKKDTAGQLNLLREWESKDHNEPEFYAAYFNYYVRKSKDETVGIERQAADKNSFELKDSTGKVAGYINDKVGYNQIILRKGFTYLDKGISMFPNRLDLRFGKVFMLGQIGNYQAFTDEIIKTLDYSKINKNAWLWSENKVKPNAETFMLESIQGYVVQLYNTNNDDLLENMKQISENVLKYYPDNVVSLSDLSIVFMIRKEYDKAIQVLLKAERLAPGDAIVLNNIAEAYKRKGDNANAVAYYEKVLKYGDEEAKQSARNAIDQLQKK